MRLAVSDICGLSGIPETNRGVRDWLKRLAISVQQDGKRFTFALSDLPNEVRRAWLDRTAEEQGLEPGTMMRRHMRPCLRPRQRSGTGRTRRRQSFASWSPRVARQG